jgi:hypothetical protein
MSFDRKRAERILVEVLDGLESDRAVGLGFRILDGVIATACHCLPRVRGKLVLPDPDQPRNPEVHLRLRHPSTGATAVAAVIAAYPCCDLALLGAPPVESLDPVDEPDGTVPLADLLGGLERGRPQPDPSPTGKVFIHTHERRWVEGIATGTSISIWRPSDRIRTGSSGAPVFDGEGLVVGLVGPNDVRLPDATMCVLADQLPGWALRQALSLESGVA